MKLETCIVITKGLCFTVIGFCAPLAAGLTQYGTDEWPNNLALAVILIAAVSGAATQLLSYLSNSYGEYQKQRNNAPQVPTVQPT